MRDLAITLGFAAMMLPVFRYPHLGVLIWLWTAMVVPSYFVFGFADAIPFNKIAAIVTLLAWLFSREPKKIPMSSTVVLLIAFAFLGTLSAVTAEFSEIALREWEKFIKIVALAFVTFGLITSKGRIDALLYAILLSLGFHGALEGVKFLLSAGAHQVWGPTGSIIGDNNHFALAMVATLPIVLYLYNQTNSRIMRLGLIGMSVLIAASVLGTYSRGGLIGIVAVGGYAMLRSKQKMRYLALVVPLAIAAIVFAPEKWSNRMDTISTAEQDESFMTRVTAWKISTLQAMDRPFLGGGFYAIQNFEVWSKYSLVFNRLDFIPTPPPNPLRSHAAHSVYFQVLGDLGFTGLAIFVSILTAAWRNAGVIIRSAGDRPEWRWARDLAISLKYSLIAYMVSGAALNMAYFDFSYLIFALLVVMRRMVGEPTPRRFEIVRPIRPMQKTQSTIGRPG